MINHIKANASQEHPVNATVKFDIVITGMNWTTNTNSLCMSFRFHGNSGSQDPSDVHDDEHEHSARVGTASFNVQNTALSLDSTSVNVNLVPGPQRLDIVYGHFVDGIVHDPEIGFIGTSTSGAMIVLPTLMMMLLFFI